MNEWVLYAIGAGLFVLIVLGLVWFVRRRQPGPAEPDPAYAWGEPADPPAAAASPPSPARPSPQDPSWAPAPAALSPSPAPEFQADPPAPAPPVPSGPVHVCKCPSCQTQFSVTGNKPIVTNCPGCGKKGYLR